MNRLQLMKILDSRPAVAKLAELINVAHLQSGRVLWLVSGGSTMPAAAETMRLLAGDGTADLSWLTIMQVDERFGPVGHAASNWQQLLESGFVPSSAHAEPMLTGQTFDETISRYEKLLAQNLDSASAAIGLFGIGADGHTAGILPHSEACELADSTALVVGYQGSDFARITITSAAIARLDAAVVFAIGAAKALALGRLQQDIPPADQPAQFLKQAKHAWIFNDQIGGDA